MKTPEKISCEISFAETNRLASSISLSLLDPYSSDYTRMYEKWQYCNDLIVHLKDERERSLLHQMLRLSKDTSARIVKMQQTCDSIVSKALRKSSISELKSAY